MKWGYLVGTILVGGPFLALLASGFGKDPSAVISPLPGNQAPDFELTTLEGERIRLGDLRGRPVVVNFWATWCIPCIQEHAVLRAGAQRYGPQGVQFLGIVYQDERERILAFLERAPVDYPTLVDPDGRTAVDYGVTGVPETFFIDAEGQVVSKMVGPLNPMELDRRVSPLLGGGGAAASRGEDR